MLRFFGGALYDWRQAICRHYFSVGCIFALIYPVYDISYVTQLNNKLIFSNTLSVLVRQSPLILAVEPMICYFIPCALAYKAGPKPCAGMNVLRPMAL